MFTPRKEEGSSLQSTCPVAKGGGEKGKKKKKKTLSSPLIERKEKRRDGSGLWSHVPWSISGGGRGRKEKGTVSSRCRGEKKSACRSSAALWRTPSRQEGKKPLPKERDRERALEKASSFKRREGDAAQLRRKGRGKKRKWGTRNTACDFSG